MLECPKRVGGQGTDGCGAINPESAQRCSECNLQLWEFIMENG